MPIGSSQQLDCFAALQNPVVTWTWTVAFYQVSSPHMSDLADRQDCHSCTPAVRLATTKAFAKHTAKGVCCLTFTQSHCTAAYGCVVLC